jgi:hypothetical protein
MAIATNVCKGDAVPLQRAFFVETREETGIKQKHVCQDTANAKMQLRRTFPTKMQSSGHNSNQHARLRHTFWQDLHPRRATMAHAAAMRHGAAKGKLSRCTATRMP